MPTTTVATATAAAAPERDHARWQQRIEGFGCVPGRISKCQSIKRWWRRCCCWRYSTTTTATNRNRHTTTTATTIGEQHSSSGGHNRFGKCRQRCQLHECRHPTTSTATTECGGTTTAYNNNNNTSTGCVDGQLLEIPVIVVILRAVIATNWPSTTAIAK